MFEGIGVHEDDCAAVGENDAAQCDCRVPVGRPREPAPWATGADVEPEAVLGDAELRGHIAMCVRLKLRKDWRSAAKFGAAFDPCSPLAHRIARGRTVLRALRRAKAAAKSDV